MQRNSRAQEPFPALILLASSDFHCSIADLEGEPGLFLSDKEVAAHSPGHQPAPLPGIRFFPLRGPHPSAPPHLQRVFAEAEEMARRYRQRLPAVPAAGRARSRPLDSLPFDDEPRLYSNWKWLRFESDGRGPSLGEDNYSP